MTTVKHLRFMFATEHFHDVYLCLPQFFFVKASDNLHQSAKNVMTCEIKRAGNAAKQQRGANSEQV